MNLARTIGLVALVALLFGLATTRETVSANAKKKTRFFELRIYTTHPGRLPALNARFRNHTNKLFKKHGMQLVGYWTPTSKAQKDNTLVYILAYPNKESRDKSWKGFISDPDWRKAYANSIKDGKIVKKVVSQYLTPTDYSPIK